MKCRRFMILFSLCFAFFLLAGSPSPLWSEYPVRTEMQGLWLTQKIQLLNSQKKIETLRKQLLDLKESDRKIIDELRRQLEEQEGISRRLSEQLNEVSNYQKRLQTERDVAITGCVVLAAGVVAISIYAAVK